MKNIKKLLGIIALVSIIALSFASCDMDDPGNDDVPKTLVITDITGESGTIMVALCENAQDLAGSIKAYNEAAYPVAPNTSVTIPLISGNKNKKGGVYTGTDPMYILIIFSDKGAGQEDTMYYYTGQIGNAGGALKYPTTEATTTLSFTKFRKNS
jgi:hypothetical protein